MPGTVFPVPVLSQRREPDRRAVGGASGIELPDAVQGGTEVIQRFRLTDPVMLCSEDGQSLPVMVGGEDEISLSLLDGAEAGEGIGLAVPVTGLAAQDERLPVTGGGLLQVTQVSFHVGQPGQGRCLMTGVRQLAEQGQGP